MERYDIIDKLAGIGATLLSEKIVKIEDVITFVGLCGREFDLSGDEMDELVRLIPRKAITPGFR